LIKSPHIGYGGLPGFGLSEEESAKLQRFWPLKFADTLETHVNSLTPKHRTQLLDTIGFFIAKFKKHV